MKLIITISRSRSRFKKILGAGAVFKKSLEPEPFLRNPWSRSRFLNYVELDPFLKIYVEPDP